MRRCHLDDQLIIAVKGAMLKCGFTSKDTNQVLSILREKCRTCPVRSEGIISTKHQQQSNALHQLALSWT
jgi:hypothetical protein